MLALASPHIDLLDSDNDEDDNADDSMDDYIDEAKEEEYFKALGIPIHQ